MDKGFLEKELQQGLEDQKPERKRRRSESPERQVPLTSVLVFQKIGKARANLAKGAVYGELRGEAVVSVDGKRMKLALYATLRRVGGIGSCFPIAFSATLANLRRNDSTTKSLRAHSDLAESTEFWKNLDIFADIGNKMKLESDCNNET